MMPKGKIYGLEKMNFNTGLKFHHLFHWNKLLQKTLEKSN